ncbi:UTP--glucose-1-phosphate uridylyltransferase GalU [Alkalihalophilus marmarensis]|uniref:UTP--glucose-1-phosphate uridylyltransferase GalU n=1 Tax=Alkalihalophilus marmarensis TaxID=521377 RepID=UPI002DBEBE13|nr:UTP--glucose-1-phosphate uridylyltransferase GalU [Alkalihalophilus marmarensis]MEC2071319.1 UTP--glucose-1-phosphate uridylyltransferase GalU [Alkalihalophilus marmarensis]
MNVRKAIIPAAGLGTRFLPATKAQPKEMLPIVDKPTIQFIVEEAVASGIEDIIIVSGRGKRAIEDHFDKSYELEETLAKREKWDMLEEMSSISNLANIHYIRQKEPLGLGHAILCASRFIGDEPFAVLLGDDVVRGEPPCLSQLMDIYERHPCSIVGVQKVAYEEVTKYGIIEPTGTALEPRLMALHDLIEKPTVEEAPSRYAIQGRYILRPEIFPILERVTPGAGGEIQLTDAIRQLNQEQTVLAYEFSGKRYDVGDKAGYLKATIDFALEREELREELLAYMESIIREGLPK